MIQEGQYPDWGEDYGLYQIYGKHILCGKDTLLYIGEATEQTFSTRFKQHQHWLCKLAKAFCISEPSTVLLNVETTEREWVQKASQPGNDYMVSLLNEYRASWAVIRQWAGYEAAIAQKEAQIQRLERLVYDAIYALQKAGLDDAANRLRRALQKT